jgi:hypothetical protein
VARAINPVVSAIGTIQAVWATSTVQLIGMARAIDAVSATGAIHAVWATGTVRLIWVAQAVGAARTGEALQAARCG